MTRILIVSPFVPFPPDRGHRVRTFWLMRQLALQYRVALVTQCFDAGERRAVADLQRAFPALDPVVAVDSFAHRTRLHRLAYAAGTRIVALGGLPRERIYHSSPAMQRAVDRVMAEWLPSLVQGEYWFSRWTIRPRAGVPVWIDSHDLHWLRLQRELATQGHPWRRWILRRRAQVIQANELAAYRSAGRVLTVHEVESERLRSCLGAVPVSTVPIACEVLPAPSGVPLGTTVLFLGALDYLPNRDALLFLAREIMPGVRLAVPSSALRVVGHRAGVRGLPVDQWIHYAGHMPDLAVAAEGVGAAVAPLRMGAGTSVKVLTLLSLGMPLVASSRAVEGLALLEGQHYLRADDAASASRAVISLLANPQAGRELGCRGREAALRLFDWRQTAPEVLRTYEEGLRS